MIHNANASMVIYPNPVTNGVVTIELKSNDNEANINLYDLQGRFVLESKLLATQNTLDLSLISGGMYIVKVSTTSGTLTQRILIK